MKSGGCSAKNPMTCNASQRRSGAGPLGDRTAGSGPPDGAYGPAIGAYRCDDRVDAHHWKGSNTVRASSDVNHERNFVTVESIGWLAKAAGGARSTLGDRCRDWGGFVLTREGGSRKVHMQRSKPSIVVLHERDAPVVEERPAMFDGMRPVRQPAVSRPDCSVILSAPPWRRTCETNPIPRILRLKPRVVGGNEPNLAGEKALGGHRFAGSPAIDPRSRRREHK